MDKATKEEAAFHPHDEAVLAKTKKAHVLVKEVAKFLGRAAEQTSSNLLGREQSRNSNLKLRLKGLRQSAGGSFPRSTEPVWTLL